MALIMEVIEKKTDFKTGAVTIKLLDTDFTGLSKYLGAETGKDWETFTSGDILSVDGLKSLNDKQLTEYLPKFETFIDSYNTWVNSNNSKVEGLLNYSYNFTSLTDWAYKYVSNLTTASYIIVLNDIVGAEKEMWEFCYYTSNNHMENNNNILKNWSRTQNYGSTVREYYSREFETKGNSTSWSNYRCNVSGVNVTGTRTSQGDKNRLIVTGLQNIPVGTTAIVQCDAVYRPYQNQIYEATANWEIKRETLGVSPDDGYYIATNHYWTGSSGAIDGINHTAYINDYTGDYSPHFDGVVTLPFLQTRILT